MNILNVSKGFPYVTYMLRAATASSAMKEKYFLRKWASTTLTMRIRQ